ncbi:MAG: hypothetical protein EBR02_07265 [Alphaproteobacteria bacterium]|nr:hypothetical protein [Alphaproteobacteria bacterium]
MKNSLAAALAVSAFSLSSPSQAAPTNYSPQNALLGATATIQGYANNGAGITFGVIDTGITKPWIGFSGNSITSASCIGSGGSASRCTNASNTSDDNGHGTFVASEIIGRVSNSVASMSGVAPSGNLIAVKVLNAQGSGTSVDTAAGIIYAVDRGAQVLNLSLGPSGSAAQQSAFYNSLASAINYAASKNAVIVFAGGNAAQAFSAGANIGGFTDAAIARMILVGSTDANKNLSSFSNTPGSAGFNSTTNKSTAYKNMWLMAQGSNVVGASNYSTPQTGYSYITQMSGTSMAAPEVAGAAGLLAARWKILLTNGTLRSVLTTTATDLGASGVDATYGSGFVNLVKAFQPIGDLTIKTANGTTVAVKTLTGSMLTTGALGNLASITSQLKNYTTFDSFTRDFFVDLSSVVTAKGSTSAAASAVTAPKVVKSALAFADGSSLAFGSVETEKNPVAMFGETKGEKQRWVASFTDAKGETVSAGYGVPAGASFAAALWGSDTAASSISSSLGVSNLLFNFSEGGTFGAYGTQLDKTTRLALSWAQTEQTQDLASTALTQANAQTIGAGLTHKFTNSWTAGLTLGLLTEKNGLLGSTYLDDSPTKLGETHQSISMGVSSSFTLGHKTDLLIDAALVRTDGASVADSIISDVSTLTSRSFGAAVAQRDTFTHGDSLLLSARKPLRVISGSAGMSMASVDDDGNPIISTQRVGLTPTGNETNFSLNYAAPAVENFSWNAGVDMKKDVNNIAGENEASVFMGASLKF